MDTKVTFHVEVDDRRTGEQLHLTYTNPVEAARDYDDWATRSDVHVTMFVTTKVMLATASTGKRAPEWDRPFGT